MGRGERDRKEGKEGVKERDRARIKVSEREKGREGERVRE